MENRAASRNHGFQCVLSGTMPLKWRGTVWRHWLCAQKQCFAASNRRQAQKCGLKRPLPLVPRPSGSGSPTQAERPRGGLIVWPHFPRQVGFRTAHGETPPSLSDHRHRLSSQRHRLAISERSAPQALALSEKSPYPRSSPNLGQPVARPTFLPRTASEVGTDLRAVRHRRHWRFRRNRPTPEAHLPPELS